MNRAAPIALALAAFVAASVIYLWTAYDGSARTSASSVFTCGADADAREMTVTREAVILAGDARFYAPCPGDHDERHREARQREVIEAGTSSADSEVARVAYVAIGRAGVFPVDPSGGLEPFVERGLAHASPAVRSAAAAALADALDGAVREPVSVEQLLADRAALDDRAARLGQAAALISSQVRARLGVETDASVVAALIETMGRLPYGRPEDRAAAETLLVERLGGGDAAARLAAARGLEFMLRRSPGLAGTTTVAALRSAAAPAVAGGPPPDDEASARVRRLAMLALAAARDADSATILAAAADPDWQVRRLAVLRLTGESREMTAALDAALADDVFQVRLDAVRLAGRAAARSGQCARVVTALDDPEIPVVLAALDALPANCREQTDIVNRLSQLAGMLGAARDHWHVPARALTALSRLAPEQAAGRLAVAVGHPVWQVRAAATDVALALGREDVVVSLAGDEVPNVRTSALRALGRMVSDARFDAAIDAVQADDFDLVRTAAGMLEDPPDPVRAADVLIEKLRTLTDDAWDTSRDPRLAIVRRLGALLPPDRAVELLPFTADFDSRIALAARDAYLAASGAAEPPADLPPQRARYPHQPSAEALMAPPRAATIELEGGVMVELELLPDDAPVLVARFVELARAGHYDGLSIHRIAPNFVIQGGSPGANEYAGVDRYVRDEIGAANWRGTVGLSTRGRDTGDAQFFVNLVDNPRLDHEYTVFARVVSGMDALDRLAEGARIVRIQTNQPG